MDFQLDILKDKVEFFEADTIKNLEKQIQQQIEVNRSILLEVHNVSYQMHAAEDGRRLYSAAVHFKAKS